MKIIPTVELKEGKHWLSLQVNFDGMSGHSQPTLYDAAFGKAHTVVLEPPEGSAQKLSSKTIRKRSIKQERKRIEAIGGRTHVGSGAFSGSKSDGSTDEWRMENKFTGARSYRVQVSDLEKIRSECRNRQQPVFNIDFQDKHTGSTYDSWVMLPYEVWKDMVNANDNRKP